MNIKNIDELLAKFRLIEDPKKDKIKALEVLSDALGIVLSEDSVSVKNSTLSVRLEPSFKSYLFTKKAGLIKNIEEKLQKNNIKILFK